jgi:hypothetical protein
MTMVLAFAMLFFGCEKEQYTVTVNVNDPEMGSVTGGGKYDVNTEATLSAIPNAGYLFVQWNDGNTDNPRKVVVTQDATYTATFAEDAAQTQYYTITVNTNDASMGTVTGGGQYVVNTAVTLTATANTGYEFVRWNDGNTSNPRTIVVTADATYTAEFRSMTGNGTIISFQGNSWQAANMWGYDYSSEGYVTYVIFKTANDQNDIYLQGYLETTPGSYDYAGTYDYFKYRDASQTWTDEYGLIGDAGTTYYRWTPNPQSFVENVTAIDLNNKSITATWSEDLFDIEQYAQLGDVPSTVYPLTGVMQNATWTWQSTSKSKAKGKAQRFDIVK